MLNFLFNLPNIALFVLYQCSMNKTVWNAYNIWCEVVFSGNLDGVREIQYYSSDFHPQRHCEQLSINKEDEKEAAVHVTHIHTPHQNLLKSKLPYRQFMQVISVYTHNRLICSILITKQSRAEKHYMHHYPHYNTIACTFLSLYLR